MNTDLQKYSPKWERISQVFFGMFYWIYKHNQYSNHEYKFYKRRKRNRKEKKKKKKKNEKKKTNMKKLSYVVRDTEKPSKSWTFFVSISLPNGISL